MALTASQISTSSSSSYDPTQQDEEVFEITDFTTVTDWERFSAQIEEIVGEWQLNHYIKFIPLLKNELATGDWEVKTSVVKFASVAFQLTLHRLKQRENTEQYQTDDLDDEKILPQYADDMMNIDNDFPPRAHCLARWYGLRCFMVLQPSETNESINYTKINLLMGSVNTALHNTSCDVPLFIQVKESWHRLYVGSALSQGIRSNFEVASLKRTPPQYSSLSGLVQVFRTKLKNLASFNPDDIKISARVAYTLANWGKDKKWPVKQDVNEMASNFSRIANGCVEDPISQLQLNATWNSTSHAAIHDNDVARGFDALVAHEWSVRLRYADDFPCLLEYSLGELVKVYDSLDTMKDLMAHFTRSGQNDVQDVGHALEKLTENTTKFDKVLPGLVSPRLAEGISKVYNHSSNFLKKGANTLGRITANGERIPRNVIHSFLSFLFSPEQVEKTLTNIDLCSELKSAPRGSFTYRLATLVSVLNLCHGGIWALAQLWHEVMLELRIRLDNGRCVPGLGVDGPDHRSCLINQKLQMLNCCIWRKKEREKGNDKEMDKEICLSEDIVEKELNENKQCKAPESSCTTKVEEKPENKSNLAEKKEIVIETEYKENVQVQTEKEQLCNVLDNKMSESDSDEFFECDDGNFDEISDEGIVSNSKNSAEASKPDVLPTKSDDGISDLKNFHHKTLEDTISSITVDGVQQTEVECNEVVDETSSNLSISQKNITTMPEGRLKKLGDAKLFKNPAKSLYVPICQDHAFLTEDQLEEQAEIFSNLGDTQEGSKVRAKMQSLSLQSDMSSFKAANPGCVLEDFVRWYSPRDFENNELSCRMKIPDNLWVTTWENSPSVPARRQKRLFDDTKEAEKVLHYLNNLRPCDVARLVTPMCIHDALITLRSNCDELGDVIPSLPLLCDQAKEKCASLMRNWNNNNSANGSGGVNDLIRMIGFAETMVERARSLKHKFKEIGDNEELSSFIRNLLEQPEIHLDGAAQGKIGKILRKYFLVQEQEKLEKIFESKGEADLPFPRVNPFPSPAGKEFILRCKSRNPSSFSQILPQRLYACLMQNSEFKLASVVTSDTTFF